MSAFRREVVKDAQAELNCKHCRKVFDDLVCKLIKIGVQIPSLEDHLASSEKLAAGRGEEEEKYFKEHPLTKEEIVILERVATGQHYLLMLAICKERM